MHRDFIKGSFLRNERVDGCTNRSLAVKLKSLAAVENIITLHLLTKGTFGGQGFRRGDQSTSIDAPPSFVTLSRVRAMKKRRPRGCKTADPSNGEIDVVNADGASIIASPVCRVTTLSKAEMLPTEKLPEKCFVTCVHHAGLENLCMMATPQRSSKTDGTQVGSANG